MDYVDYLKTIPDFVYRYLGNDTHELINPRTEKQVMSYTYPDSDKCIFLTDDETYSITEIMKFVFPPNMSFDIGKMKMYVLYLNMRSSDILSLSLIYKHINKNIDALQITLDEINDIDDSLFSFEIDNIYIFHAKDISYSIKEKLQLYSKITGCRINLCKC